MDSVEFFKIGFPNFDETNLDLIDSKKKFSKILSKARTLAKGGFSSNAQRKTLRQHR
jgi:hypothetical protein